MSTSRIRANGPGRRSLDQGAFTLIELLIATALVVAVIGAVAALAIPVRRAFDRGLTSAEAVARARTAIATVVAEARNAGTGVGIGPTDVGLGDVMAVVERLSPSVVAMTRATGPQGVLRKLADAGALSLELHTAKPCAEQDATCGVRAGDAAVIFDRTKGESISIARVTNETATLHLASPLRFRFNPGAAIAAVERTTFRVREDRLVRVTPGGAEQPIADHVSEFMVNQARNRLDIYLRLESLLPELAAVEIRTSIGLRR